MPGLRRGLRELSGQHEERSHHVDGVDPDLAGSLDVEHGAVASPRCVVRDPVELPVEGVGETGIPASTGRSRAAVSSPSTKGDHRTPARP